MRSLILLLTIIALMGTAFGQQFEKIDGVARLSGTNVSIFELGMFQSHWTFDTTAYSLTPSQSAFLKDNPDDGRPIGMNRTPLRLGGNWK